MKLPNENDVLRALILVPLIFLLWALTGGVVYEIIKIMFW